MSSRNGLKLIKTDTTGLVIRTCHSNPNFLSNFMMESYFFCIPLKALHLTFSSSFTFNPKWSFSLKTTWPLHLVSSNDLCISKTANPKNILEKKSKCLKKCDGAWVHDNSLIKYFLSCMIMLQSYS